MAEFTGERVIPGEVDADLLNEHLARYIFAARLAKRKRVLDTGCGAGYGTAELGRSALEAVGVDLSADAIGHARTHYASDRVRFVEGSCTDLPVADGSFDLVVGFEVIEHLADWRAYLQEARRVLAPGGQFIVSTPNKLYYAESRRKAGANPFHVHEFEYAEFRKELSAVFPHVSLFVENHAAGVIFQPVAGDSTADVRVEGACVPEESHFFVAVCALRPQTGAPTFIYVPKAANVLREREQHIQLLESELATKNDWLEKAKSELAALNEDHQKVLAMFRRQTVELEERNRWADQINRELEASGNRVKRLQNELADEQSASRQMADSYEAKVAELEKDVRARTQWALDTERRLGGELEQKAQELGRCVELLDQAERTVEERTRWAQDQEKRASELDAQLSSVKGSRWLKLGRTFGLGPNLGE